MSINLLTHPIVNGYRRPGKFYSKRGHTGEDYLMPEGSIILAPVTGKVVMIRTQKEMGKCLYLLHEATGDIHVFAHNKGFLVGLNDEVQRGQEFLVSGNTGTATTAPHCHWEIIAQGIINPEDAVMLRKELPPFTGYNTRPSQRVLRLYEHHNIDVVTLESKTLKKPAWLTLDKVFEDDDIVKVPFPDWIL